MLAERLGDRLELLGLLGGAGQLRGVAQPLAGLAGVVDRGVRVLARGQGVERGGDPLVEPLVRLLQRRRQQLLARLLRPGRRRQRRVLQEALDRAAQGRVALAVERGDRGGLGLRARAREVPGDLRLHRAEHQLRRQRPQRLGDQLLLDLQVAGGGEGAAEPAQLLDQRLGAGAVEDRGEGLQGAAHPAGGDPQLVDGVLLVPAGPQVLGGEPVRVLGEVAEDAGGGGALLALPAGRGRRGGLAQQPVELGLGGRLRGGGAGLGQPLGQHVEQPDRAARDRHRVLGPVLQRGGVAEGGELHLVPPDLGDLAAPAVAQRVDGADAADPADGPDVRAAEHALHQLAQLGGHLRVEALDLRRRDRDAQLLALDGVGQVEAPVRLGVRRVVRAVDREDDAGGRQAQVRRVVPFELEHHRVPGDGRAHPLDPGEVRGARRGGPAVAGRRPVGVGRPDCPGRRGAGSHGSRMPDPGDPQP